MYKSQLQQQLPKERYRELPHNAYMLRTQDSLGLIAKKLLVETRPLTKHSRVLI